MMSSVTCDILYKRRGAFQVRRILFHEDITGKEITGKLLASGEESLTMLEILEYTTMTDIIEEADGC